MTDTDSLDNLDGIAVVGLTGRFPGAETVNDFWHNLRDGVESVSFFSDEELRAAGVDEARLASSDYVKAKAVLDNVDLFDAKFFGYTPREAEIIDPQQRLFLECAWEALETAGYDSDTYQGKIGVFAGTNASSYLLHNLLGNRDVMALMGGYQILIANDKDHLSTRVSYKLNLKGPSVNIQTACSTSLVAVHLACQSLLNYQSDMVLAGGVTVALPQKTGYVFQQGGIASPDGHCRVFDADARGTVGGSGIGIVVLKRLEDAIADGDTIHAVIKGSAINNDGSGKAGYTAPSVQGQAAVIAEAQAIAGIEPDSISYVEAHGTGTPIGDPIELKALTQIFRAQTTEKSFCAIGSVKSNIGHLDSAAGIAGLIKTILALKHQEIPPSLHFNEPNPQFDYENIPFYVNSKLTPWHANGTPRRAGVSSFGIGGTNAHVVIEEAPVTPELNRSQRVGHVLLISAMSDQALEHTTRNLENYLRSHPETNLEDIAYTLTVGRRAFDHRRAIICRDHAEALAALSNTGTTLCPTGVAGEAQRPLAFLFAGQGAQRVGMGRELYESEEVFHAEFDRCADFLWREFDFDLRSLIFAPKAQDERAAEVLRQTEITQPALFAFEYALAKQWMAWGVQPSAMIGHSIGEYVAACLAGVFSLEDALRVVTARGRLMQRLPTGAMLAVMEEDEPVALMLEPYPELSIAAVNADTQCVVSGITEAVDRFERELNRRGVVCKRLETSHAFHSAMMDPILDNFRLEVERVKLHTPRIPWISNVTGKWITPEEATDPGYWVRHIRETVRFAEGVHTLLKEKGRVLLEIGPGRALSTLAQLSPEKGRDQLILSSFPQIEAGSEELQLLSAAGRLWVAGVKIEWSRLFAGEQRRRVPLPTYPFERQRFWVESQRSTEPVSNLKTSLTKKTDIADWFYVPTWKQSLAPLSLETGQMVQGQKRWLIFLDDLGIGAQLVERLEREGQYVITVRRAETFERLGEREYKLDPVLGKHYHKMLQELMTEGRAPQKVVHLWSLSAADATQNVSQRFDDAQRAGYYSLLSLTQGLGVQLTLDPLEINVVTNNMQQVAGSDLIYPERATMLAPCKIAPQEYPNMRCRSIDVTLPRSASQEEVLLEQLLAEITTDPSDPVIAYRGADRWVQSFEPVRLDEKKRSRNPLRDQGVYLITGGLGGVGLILAEYLARTVRGKLVLMRRTPFPAREEWAEWLDSHEEDSQLSQKIRQVQQLEELGAEVLILTGDAADETHMRNVLADVHERFGEINGVIHAAGLVGQAWNPTIDHTARIESEKHFRPKIEAAIVLDKLFEDRPLDFFMLVSSLSAVLGGYGLVAYSAANLFLDAFAHSHRTNGKAQWLSVDWDGWRVYETAEPKRGYGSNLAELEILPAEGAEAMQRILSQTRTAQVVVSTGDLSQRINRWIDREPLAEVDATEQSGSSTLHQRPDLESAYVAPRNEMEETIAEIWQTLLGVDKPGINDDFYELGGHSLVGIHLLFRLRETFEAPGLQLNKLIERPTIAGLAESIDETRRSEIDLPDIIVPLQPEGTKPPFFCVHPIGGDVSSLIELSRYMAPDQPFYGIQAPGIGDIINYGEYNSLEEMATEYIEAIKFVDPEGPYFLGGFSYGGLVAYEMAVQLRQQGAEVALLGMMDTPAPDNAARVSQLDDATILFGLARERARQHGTELRLTLGELKRLKTEEEQITLLAELLRGANLLPPGLQDKWIFNFIKGFRIRVDIAVNYVPKRYDRCITVFLATERDSEMETSYDRVMFDLHDPTLGWDKLTDVPIQVLPVSGFHEMIVREPHVRVLAKQMRVAIENALKVVSVSC